MKKKIICLTDYKGNFNSKWLDFPYRSGMKKELLVKHFEENEIKIEFKKFNEVEFNEPKIKGNFYIYTSSEDFGNHYKNFIEDIVLGIQDLGGIVIPKYKYLRAHNNKVYMELLRNSLDLPGGENINTKFFGTLEELLEISNSISYPVIFKLAVGSSGSNVELVKSRAELLSTVKKYCRTRHIEYDIRDFARTIKRKGYKRESLYRNKFILQSYIPNLVNDWKVYVFYDKYFIFYRPVFKNRIFKASGGGYDNYYYGSKAQAPDGIFDFAEKAFNILDVPNVSLDIAFDGKSFVLFEFQCLYFGTAGIVNSDEYFIKKNNSWVEEKNGKVIEKEYAESIIKYLQVK